MEFGVLGPLQAAVHGATAPARRARSRRALLALLLLNPNEVVSRERAIDCLWGERPPGNAVNGIQVRVHDLRKLLGADRVADPRQRLPATSRQR